MTLAPAIFSPFSTGVLLCKVATAISGVLLISFKMAASTFNSPLCEAKSSNFPSEGGAISSPEPRNAFAILEPASSSCISPGSSSIK